MLRRGLRIWIADVSWCSLVCALPFLCISSALQLPFPALAGPLLLPDLRCGARCRSRERNVIVAPHRGFWGHRGTEIEIGPIGIGNLGLHNIPVILREGEADSRHICDI